MQGDFHGFGVDFLEHERHFGGLAVGVDLSVFEDRFVILSCPCAGSDCALGVDRQVFGFLAIWIHVDHAAALRASIIVSDNGNAVLEIRLEGQFNGSTTVRSADPTSNDPFDADFRGQTAKSALGKAHTSELGDEGYEGEGFDGFHEWE